MSGPLELTLDLHAAAQLARTHQVGIAPGGRFGLIAQLLQRIGLQRARFGTARIGEHRLIGPAPRSSGSRRRQLALGPAPALRPRRPSRRQRLADSARAAVQRRRVGVVEAEVEVVHRAQVVAQRAVVAVRAGVGGQPFGKKAALDSSVIAWPWLASSSRGRAGSGRRRAGWPGSHDVRSPPQVGQWWLAEGDLGLRIQVQRLVDVLAPRQRVAHLRAAGWCTRCASAWSPLPTGTAPSCRGNRNMNSAGASEPVIWNWMRTPSMVSSSPVLLITRDGGISPGAVAQSQPQAGTHRALRIGRQRHHYMYCARRVIALPPARSRPPYGHEPFWARSAAPCPSARRPRRPRRGMPKWSA